MPKMIPNVSIGVSRKRGSRNVTIFPAIGEMFDFTEEEIKQVKAEHPNGLRRPINETTEEPAEVTSEEEGAEEEGAEEKEETSQTQYTGRLTPQQQRQRDAQAQREARRAGRRTHSEDDL